MVLIVEDDAVAARAIAIALQAEGFSVAHAEDGREGLMRPVGENFDAIVLDRLLPGLDGQGLLTALRSAGVQTPVLILSALSDLDERMRGLRPGSDGDLGKPFERVELTARVQALLRRRATASVAEESTLQVGELVVDLLKRTVGRGPRSIQLVPREYDLLVTLMKHAGQIVTRTMLFEAVWTYRLDERSNVIDVHIGRLRRKINGEGEPPMIFTVRGAGYVLKAPA
jgi:DNA-binding response OmpR family regulator